MSVPTECRICSGPLYLRFRGGESAAESERLSPTNHRPGQHGDLYAAAIAAPSSSPRCRRASDLHDLYRAMRRRRLPRRGGRPPAHRAPPARPDRRAAFPPGACSTSAAATACCSTRRAGAATRSPASSCPRAPRRTPATSLGLDVRERAARRPRRRRRRLRRDRARRRARAPRRPGRRRSTAAQSLLAPGRRRCASSRPTPRRPPRGSPAARWWGYLPAHTYLLPRAHAARAASPRAGSCISEDVPLVRSFALSYWVGGLARAQRPRRARRRLARAAACRPAHVSLSLGDERVVLAHRRAADHAAGAARAGPRRRPQGARRAAGLQRRADDPAGGRGAAGRRRRPRAAGGRREPRRDRRGGAARRASTCSAIPPTAATAANQKTCYTRAALDGADIVVMVHADNQYDPALVAEMVRADRGGLRRRGDRLAAARGRDDRGRHAALEVDRQPLPHLGREPRPSGAASRSTTRATAPSRSTSCARSRSCATATASCSTRRSSPRSWRATPAWWSSRSPRATSSRPRASRSATSVSTGCARSACSPASGSTSGGATGPSFGPRPPALRGGIAGRDEAALGS